MSNTNEATQKALDTVRRTRERFSQAKAASGEDVRRITQRSAASISVSQMNQAVDLIADVKRSCDNYYTTLNSCAVILDEVCRPLLAELSDEAIRDIAALIADLNREASSISADFSASLNAVDIGDLGTFKYIASLEAQAAEKYWEGQYALTALAEREKQEQIARREQQRLKEQEQIAAQKRSEDIDAEEQAHKRATEREQETLLRRFRQSVDEHCLVIEKAIDGQAQQLTAALQTRLETTANELDELGFFAFSKKKELTADIETLQQEIAAIGRRAASAKQEVRARGEQLTKKAADAYSAYMGRRFPYATLLKQAMAKALGSCTPHERTRMLLCDALARKGGDCTIDELTAFEPRLAEQSTEHLSSAMRMLALEGVVRRQEAPFGNSRFSLIGLSPLERFKPDCRPYEEDPSVAATPFPTLPDLQRTMPTKEFLKL